VRCSLACRRQSRNSRNCDRRDSDGYVDSVTGEIYANIEVWIDSKEVDILYTSLLRKVLVDVQSQLAIVRLCLIDEREHISSEMPILKQV
jgi:hypothetical protein